MRYCTAKTFYRTVLEEEKTIVFHENKIFWIFESLPYNRGKVIEIAKNLGVIHDET